MGEFFTFLDFRFACLFVCFCTVSFEERDKSGNCCGTSSIFFTFTDSIKNLTLLLGAEEKESGVGEKKDCIR